MNKKLIAAPVSLAQMASQWETRTTRQLEHPTQLLLPTTKARDISTSQILLDCDIETIYQSMQQTVITKPYNDTRFRRLLLGSIKQLETMPSGYQDIFRKNFSSPLEESVNAIVSSILKRFF